MDNCYKEQVTIIIPTLNESATIEKILAEFYDEGYKNIIVIDGNSTDNTVEIAAKYARVLLQTGKGKGNAIKEVIPYINTKYVLLLDGDGTNPPKFANLMMIPLITQCYEHTIGNRLLNYDRNAFKIANLIGNIIANKVFKLYYKKDMQDILSGYRGFTLESLKNLHLESDGFEIETEISAKIVKNKYAYKVVPTYYKARAQSAQSKLHPFKDGKKIMKAILKYRK